MPTKASDLGYVALKKESTRGTAVIPDTFAPIYSEDINTTMNYDEDTPIIGNKAARYQNLKGQRGHTGSISTLAEPNTAAYYFDMLLNKSNTTGSDPYTHTFEVNSTRPNSYTVDISYGNYVERYVGTEASSIENEYSDNKMQFNVTIHALKKVGVRTIASSSTSTITLDTDYDPAPTDGFVTGDLVRIELADGTTEDFTITSVDNDTDITLDGTPATTPSAGDTFYLRPQSSPSYSLLSPFRWALTEYRYADDASTALSATQTQVDESTYSIIHNVNEDEGEKRSGSYDPVELARLRADVEISVTKFFDTPQDMNKFYTNQKQALVIRHFSEDQSYELRVTLNNIKLIENPTDLSAAEIIMSEATLRPEYDDTDGQMFDVKVINALSTV